MIILIVAVYNISMYYTWTRECFFFSLCLVLSCTYARLVRDSFNSTNPMYVSTPIYKCFSNRFCYDVTRTTASRRLSLTDYILLIFVFFFMTKSITRNGFSGKNGYRNSAQAVGNFFGLPEWLIYKYMSLNNSEKSLKAFVRNSSAFRADKHPENALYKCHYECLKYFIKLRSTRFFSSIAAAT